jgi:hypothetical protein
VFVNAEPISGFRLFPASMPIPDSQSGALFYHCVFNEKDLEKILLHEHMLIIAGSAPADPFFEGGYHV